MRVYLMAPRRPVVDAALEAGLDVILLLASPEVSADYRDMLDLRRLVVGDLANPLAVIEALRGDGVLFGSPEALCVGLSDLSVEVACLVNMALGLRADRYASFESLEVMRDKTLTRTRLSAHGLACTGRYRRVEVPVEVEEELHVCPRGIVVKPINGSGSRGVHVVTSDADWAQIAAEVTYPCLVEERFVGPEFSVESLTIDGEHQCLMVTEKLLGGHSGVVEMGHIQPARITDDTRESLFAAARSVLDAVGYAWGLSHLEFILDKDGPKLVEAHGRVGGDRIADMLRYSTGANAFERLMYALCHRTFLPIKDTGQHARIDYVNLPQDGMDDERWLVDCAANTSIVEYRILKTPGERGNVTQSADRHAFALSVTRKE